MSLARGDEGDDYPSKNPGAKDARNFEDKQWHVRLCEPIVVLKAIRFPDIVKTGRGKKKSMTNRSAQKACVRPRGEKDD